MKKTKIIATVGPNSNSRETLKAMINAGMNVARFNLSHADHEHTKAIVDLIRELNVEMNTNVGILIDTKGPELRVECYNKEAVKLSKGDQIILTSNKNLQNDGKFFVNHTELNKDLQKDDIMVLGDGTIELKIIEENIDEVVCELLNDGEIRNEMGLNVPGVDLTMDFLSMTDKKDIEFASAIDADFVALSFVRNANDVMDVNDILISLENEHIQIISKIENKQAVENLDNIIKVSDGIMVARGDLGVEIDLEEVPSVQKEIASKSFLANKICIVATQMLSSMQFNPRPTRAEVSDVANAVVDGVDAVMLSEETAVGKYPVETVETMSKIIECIEKNIDYDHLLNSKPLLDTKDITSVIAHNVVDSANRIKAKAIVVSTISGYTAQMVSGFRPICPIVVTTPNKDTARSLSLNYGTVPVLVEMFDSTDKIVANAVSVVKEMFVLENDKIIITGGFPMATNKSTNFMKIEEITE
ncbi:MAG: pyruvate kinase [Bacilli bacterium]|nr:pyruvate kinase [Bacilli bacterium]